MKIGLSFEQSAKMEQRQVLSQRQIQSMELLQIPIQKLEDRIKLELISNPILETADSRYNSADPPDNPSPSLPVSEEARQFERARQFSEDYPDSIDEEQPRLSRGAIDDAQTRYDDRLANIPNRSETLQDHLLSQLVWYNLPEEVHQYCEKIIWNLDPRGRLISPLGENPNPIEYFVLPENPSDEQRLEAYQALDVVRKLDPKGVGAFSTAETLLLQLEGDDPDTAAARLLLTEYTKDLENNRLPQIAKKSGLSLEQIEAGLRKIRTLNPFPTSEFSSDPTQYVIPDVIVEKNDEGHWVARSEDNPLFDLRISPQYRAELRKKEITPEAKAYLRRNIGSAQWFIDAVAARRRTILAVAQAIVDYQSDFFDYGPSRIRPLKMQQIADTLGIHIATVSRTCDDKWLACPSGTFPFKRFFTRAVPAAEDQEGMVQDNVKERIRALIDGEDKHAPLSDEDILKHLKAEGIEVSRRTVAKYRDAMNIPSSRGRKVWK